MRAVVVAALLAVAAATVVRNDLVLDVLINKENLTTVDVKTKELIILKLLNHIIQPTVYTDIREVAREWTIEENNDKYLRSDVVKVLLDTMRTGMLPRGEVFVHTDEVQLEQAVRLFRVLYFAKDFDVFARTACWMRERVNGGMFAYALTAAVFHRVDCRGIILPAPYEIYPYFFVEGNVITRAHMMKMTKAATDPVVAKYYGITVTDKNIVVLDWRKGVRRALTEEDRISYFTEDIDLNTFMYYLNMNYPMWMLDDVYGLNKERRGEVLMYAYMQLLARLRLERLGRNMCDIPALDLDRPLDVGYWPRLLLHTGDNFAMRSNDVLLINDRNVKDQMLVEDIESLIRQGIMTGKIEMRDGTMINLKKAEDIEYLGRIILGGIGLVKKDDAKVVIITDLLRKILGYNTYNRDSTTYIPTVVDMYATALRDPVFWRLMKRVMQLPTLFKRMLPRYTHEDLDFPGVRIERIVTDKLVTFMDEYDVDITNAVHLDDAEMKKMRSDMLFVARARRLNHQPFKVNIDVLSEKATDAVVRIFIGPKFDCMGRLMDLNDKRLDMVEIDSFIYKLDTGKNSIVRDSREMHNVIDDRPWTRTIWDKVLRTTGNVKMTDGWWSKTRVGFPRRLLLPLGRKGGFPLEMYVVVTPVRNGMLLPTVDITMMKERRVCYWTSCIDQMPLGFPFDRRVDMARLFAVNNIKMTDIMVFRKDLTMANMSKDVDMSMMVMRRDDLTRYDTDMLMRRSYRDVMLASNDAVVRT